MIKCNFQFFVFPKDDKDWVNFYPIIMAICLGFFFWSYVFEVLVYGGTLNDYCLGVRALRMRDPIKCREVWQMVVFTVAREP